MQNAAALTGAGHGIYSPVQITTEPFGLFGYAWTLTLILLYSRWQPAIIFGTVLLMTHYLFIGLDYWLLGRLWDDYFKLNDSERRASFNTWLWLYACVNIASWVGLWIGLGSRKRSKTG